MLDDKRQGLLRERARLAAVVDETREAWEREVRQVELWLRRALLISGQRSFELARGPSSRTAEYRMRSVPEKPRPPIES